ncbi:MAG: hypothetical protein KGZ69_15150 [Methylomonas sp.]|nr:hypothetical protein [Methylomonas sp.]
MSDFDYYDLEAIKSFITKVNANHSKGFDRFVAAKRLGIEPQEESLSEGLTNDEILAVTRSLAALVFAGVDLKLKFGIRKRSTKKRSGTRLDETIHSPEFGVVMAYVSRDITHTQAVNKIMGLRHVEKRQAESFIKKRRQAAIDAAKIRQMILTATAAK